MRIALGADHKGYQYKERVKEILSRLGHEVTDFGTNSEESVDYPDFGEAAARAVIDGQADIAIGVCWTGNGINIAANKVHGIRSALVLSPEMAHLARAHNNANFLALSGKYTPEDQLEAIVTEFLSTEFEGGRHARRVDKLTAEDNARVGC